MKNAKKGIKEKVKAKASATKDKVKGKLKGARKCRACSPAAVALAAVYALALAGCLDTAPASRATTANYRIDVTVKVDDGARGNTFNLPFTIGDGALASADSAGSTETQTTTPTQDIKPQTDIAVPVNKAGAAQSVGSTLGDAAASFIKGVSSSGDAKAADCANGACDPCANGACDPK